MEDRVEAVVVCLDNSNYMINEDYIPSRWGAQTHAVSWILNSMGVSHAFALLTMAGRRAEILSPVNTDITQLHHAMDGAKVGGECCVQSSLQLAQMVLRNRPPRCTAARVIIFSGSPVSDSIESMTAIAKSYKKNNIALDVISFGDAPVELLQQLVNIVDNNDNSHFIESPPDDTTLSVSMINILLPDDNGILHQAPHIPPPSARVDSDPPPVLRMPPPNRVCRRVVVDHTKYAAHRAASSPPPSTLSLSLTLSLSSPRSDTSLQNNNSNSNNGTSSSSSSRFGANNRDRDRVVLLVPFPSQRNKKIIVEFRAGRSQVTGGGVLGAGSSTPTVRPIKRKGQLALLSINDDLFQFVWRDRATGMVELDLLIHPRDATFSRVPEHITPARVYCLHVLETNKRHFFWMQHNDVAKDEDYCNAINACLNRSDPHTPMDGAVVMGGASPNGQPLSSRQYHTLNASDLQQLLTLYSLPLSFASRGARPSSSSGSSNPLPLRGRSSSSRSTLQPEADGSRRWIKNPIWMQNSRARSLMDRVGEEASSSTTSSSSSRSSHSPDTTSISNPAVPPPTNSIPLLSPPPTAAIIATSSLSTISPSASVTLPISAALSPETTTSTSALSTSSTPAVPEPAADGGAGASHIMVSSNNNLADIISRYEGKRGRKDSEEDRKS